MKGKSLLISCSNRSEYGLLRPLVFKLNTLKDLPNISSKTFLLFSDAVSSCISDVQRDYLLSEMKIEILNSSIQKKKESILEHFSRLLKIFSFNHLSKYDAVLIAGDRYENTALALSCFFTRTPVVHFFGGDLSHGGHFDDHLRHVISHLSSVHFPVNVSAKNNLLAMHQESSRIFHIGSPVVDEISTINHGINTNEELKWDIIISFNPMTLGASNSVCFCLEETLKAIDELSQTVAIKCLATRPNNEPGSKEINELLDKYSNRKWLDIVKSLGSPAFWYAIKNASLVVGNSSAQLLEVPLLGTHSLLIGNRQKGRHMPNGVCFLADLPKKEEIKIQIQKLLKTNRIMPCLDYGKEGVSDKMAYILNDLMRLSKSELVFKSNSLERFHEF